jgi:heme exporter protein D
MKCTSFNQTPLLVVFLVLVSGSHIILILQMRRKVLQNVIFHLQRKEQIEDIREQFAEGELEEGGK